MEKVTLDPAIKFGAGRYRQEKNLLEECGKEISRFGKRVFIIAGNRAWDAVKERMIPGFEKAGIEYELHLYSGKCSYEAAREYADTGVVNIPTSIATCAAFTTMSVMYTPEGAKKDCWRFEHEVDAVLVDLQVIAECPIRYAAAGILDAMAKKIEIQNGKPKMYLSENKIDLFSAYKMAEYTYEVLVEYGAQAIEDIRHKRLTKAVEDITFINIAVTGVIANITKSFSQSALGHMMYDGVRTYFTKEAEHALHGEIVAVALFTQLYYNKLSEDKEALRLFMKGMDMPLTLQELGIEPTQKNLDILEAYLIDSPYVEQSEESFKLLHEAMKQMC